MERLAVPDHKVFKFLRKNKKFPHIFCPGCGHGIILGAFIRAVDNLGINKDKIVLVSGIGCSSRAPVYVDFNTVHTLHGRAIAYATGIKLANPDLIVVVMTGDGDAAAIGGNHFIHACRRNIDINTIIFNNNIYGMTGGQYSPTTPISAIASTSPYGNIEKPFDICELAEGAGAAFVARGTAFNVNALIKIFEKSLLKKGFCVVEAVSNCHTAFGRKNGFKNPVDMLKWMRDSAVDIRAWDKLPPEKRKGKFKVGVFADHDYPEYISEYDKIMKVANGGCND